MAHFSLLRLILIFSVIVYFIFEHIDEKQVKDEREELIRLKTFELVHKVTTSTLCVLAIVYLFVPQMPALYPMLAVIFSFLYTEIFGKIYFRRRF
jgi:fatty acid desaturase